MTISQILLSGAAVTVDLLTEMPTSTDPATWKIVNSPSYQPLISIPIITNNQGGNLTGYFRGPAVPPGITAVWFAARVGGSLVIWGPISPPATNVFGLLTCQFFIQPWFAGGL
jgi:hypothetical protein